MTENTNPVVAALPGTGWFAMYRDYDGLEHGEAVAGWLVHTDGTVKPFTIDQNGDQADPRTLDNFTRLVHFQETR
ncbi:hypothetical protein [Streptomyces sp. SID8499]|uniref:hypothetical protein n=1 Tax=Streptomyces sp. SID8499 TaxID=2706106 RepID=UPI0013CDDA76|nr:hypothetical protein [Streptomyces sp. SID8499]NED31967.1 hypothetical protein [Streptomyces sp. SID8499]